MEHNLTHIELEILKYLDANTYISRAEAFHLFSVSSDYSIDHLIELGYVRLLPPNSSDQADWFVLTSKGTAFVKELLLCESDRQKELQCLQKEAKSAKRHAVFADVLAVLALIVAIAAPFLSAYATSIVNMLSQMLK